MGNLMNIIIVLSLLISGCGDSNEVILKKADKAYSSKDYATAATLYSKLAKNGNAKAQAKLGVLYAMGWGVEKNGKEAVSWYAKAAEQGEVDALNNVANAYKYGRAGAPMDYAEAIKWYEKCVAHSACYYEFGDMYEMGLGMQEDQVEAARLYKLGATHIENPKSTGEITEKEQSEIRLARMYANGWGVQKDCGEAVRLMTLAANRHPYGSNSNIARRKLEESSCPGQSNNEHQW